MACASNIWRGHSEKHTNNCLPFDTRIDIIQCVELYEIIMMPNTARELDDNGYLVVRGCPLSSFGIFDYSARQVGLPGDPNRIVKVYRPESAVSEPEAIDSFKNVPFINEHEMLHGTDETEGAAPEEKGVDGILTSNVYYDKPWMRGDIKVFSRSVKRELQKGKSDLSLGYGCQFEHKPGIWNGQPYEVIQTRLRGNHIALVGEGRVPGARVLDGLVFDHLSFESVKPYEDESMPIPVKKKVGDNAVEQLKALIPALQQFLNEEAQEPEHQEAANPGEATEAQTPDVAEEPDQKPESAETVEAGEQPQPGDAPTTVEEAPGGEGDALSQLIPQIKALLAELESAVPGGDTVDEGMTNEPSAEDAVEGIKGLQESSNPGAQVCADDETTTETPKASPGPSAGTHAHAGDSSLQHFYADVAIKNRLYDRLSKVVGAFDHAAMDSAKVVDYGVAKLKLKVGDSKAFDVLNAHLDGIELAQRKAADSILKRNSMDSAAAAPEIESYIKGE
ncbi:prohead protease [Serratia phage vB_SmaM_Hera]|uniref:Prohead protease n=1 Tax=Serratia phage vB_SmaM_Hera TaxID=2777369 RepID=A0A7T3N9B0_9CAUD|nr:prohead protease [Serratia phage vB_SmaM_Hera]